MDVTVTARIPVEIKEQASVILRDLGSTPTQLINAAYRYLLQEKALPDAKPALSANRKLTPEQLAAIQDSWKRMAVPGAHFSNGGEDFKQQLAEARDQRYAAFA